MPLTHPSLVCTHSRHGETLEQHQPVPCSTENSCIRFSQLATVCPKLSATGTTFPDYRTPDFAPVHFFVDTKYLRSEKKCDSAPILYRSDSLFGNHSFQHPDFELTVTFPKSNGLVLLNCWQTIAICRVSSRRLLNLTQKRSAYYVISTLKWGKQVLITNTGVKRQGLIRWRMRFINR